jgi:hypothetical protein
MRLPSVSASLEDDQKVIAHRTDERPARDSAIQAPEAVVPGGMALAQSRQIRWGSENTQSPEVGQLEMGAERTVELPRPIVVRPDSVAVHSYRHEAARVADPDSGPSATARVVADFPRTDAANYREHERATRLDQASALPGRLVEIRHAVKWPKVGIRSVIGRIGRETLQFLTTETDGRDTVRDAFARRTIRGPAYHLRRPVCRGHFVSQPRHAHRIEPRSATDVDQSARRGKGGIEPVPHLLPHLLDQVVIAPGTVVVRGDAVECVPGLTQVGGVC